MGQSSFWVGATTSGVYKMLFTITHSHHFADQKIVAFCSTHSFIPMFHLYFTMESEALPLFGTRPLHLYTRCRCQLRSKGVGLVVA
jgi:hypothetical protein